MTEPYVAPDAVGTLDARKILAFLNQARTAREIADTVEFPAERDVGLGVAQRILDRRAQLGAFTSLQQVADVPQVGPERFTEIVLALSRRPTAEDVAVAFVEEIVREAHLLRAQLEVLRSQVETRPQISLRAVPGGPYVGQPARVVATVTTGGPPEPAVDIPVTFTTTWGRLRTFGTPGSSHSSAVTARTDVLGNATVALAAPTSEPLLDSQRSALVAMLAVLNPAAATPRSDETGLRELVRRYRWRANTEFRSAVDILFRDFGRDAIESVNHHDLLDEWRHFDATVFACAHGQDDGTSVLASAATTLAFRDWLGPWVQTHLALLDSETLIRDDLTFQKQRGDTAGIVDRVGGRLSAFLDAQPGIAGRYIGQQIVRSSLEDFLQTEIDDLPLREKTMVFPALQVASITAAANGLPALQTLHETRAGVRTELSGIEQSLTRIGAEVEAKAGLEALQNLETRLVTDFDTKLQDALAQKVDAGEFQAALAQKVDAGEFQAALAQKVDVGTFQAELRTKADRTTVDRALAAKVDASSFETRLEGLDAKISRIEGGPGEPR